MVKRVFFSLLTGFMLCATGSLAQDSLNISHYAGIKVKFEQLKDQFNYGLVYSGGGIEIQYLFQRSSDKDLLQYHGSFGMGLNSNKGMGVNITLIPCDLFYGHKLRKDKNSTTYLGGYFLDYFNWQLYPDVQSGHLFWFSSLEIGPQVIHRVHLRSSQLSISLANSFTGFLSRPVPSTETTYYSLKLSNFIKKARSHMTPGSFESFNHTRLRFDLQSKNNRRIFSYGFNYFGYFKNPDLNYIEHSLSIILKIGK